MREFAHRDGLAVEQLAILLLQLVHRSRSGTARTLIRRHADALDVAQLLQRLQRHDHHNRRAVRVGDDATRTVQRVLGVALGHHQRHIVVHTERTRIVDHHATVLRNRLGKLLRCSTASRHKRHVDAFEIVVVLQQLHFVFFTTKSVFAARTTLRAEQNQFVDGEIALS